MKLIKEGIGVLIYAPSSKLQKLLYSFVWVDNFLNKQKLDLKSSLSLKWSPITEN